TARIVVLDDDCGWFLKFGGEAARRLEIDEVVVGEFFALQLFGCGQSARCFSRGYIESGSLMRVYAIAQWLELFKGDVHALRQHFLCDQRGMTRLRRKPFQ